MCNFLFQLKQLLAQQPFLTQQEISTQQQQRSMQSPFLIQQPAAANHFTGELSNSAIESFLLAQVLDEQQQQKQQQQQQQQQQQRTLDDRFTMTFPNIEPDLNSQVS